MKHLLSLLLVAAFSIGTVQAAEEKKVCTAQKDVKTGKEKQVCKTIKIHKKLEGTKVPDKK